MKIDSGLAQVYSLQLLGAMPYKARTLVARNTGRTLWSTHSSARRISQINIDLAFPEKSQRWRHKLCKDSLIETALTACEFGAVWHQPPSAFVKRIHTVEGEALIEAARDAGKGIIILAPHLGNWEILGNYLATHYAITNLYQPPKSPALDQLIRRARTRNRAKLAPTSRRGIIQIVKTLRGGGMTGILPDQEPDTQSGGVWAPFFGVQALTATIVSKLVSDGNSVVIGGFCLRDKNGYKVIFRPVDPELYDPCVERSCAAMNRSIESYIMEAPSQYHWEYKRFNTRPNIGDPKLYNDDRVQE